jgi:hypothetical protein
MSSAEKLSSLIEAINNRKAKSERFVHETISVWEMFLTGIVRQRVYLIWTAALTAMHILEIWVLIRFHYAYPPPSGLTALRVISSLSLVGLFGALSFRWADFDSQIGQPTHSSVTLRLSRLFDSARIVLMTGAAGALLVGIWVVVFSKLQLSSPPAFRAVIFSGILSLPIDITANFLLYLSGTVCALPVSRRLRALTFAGSLLALVFLALDLPLFYLCFALAPRIFLLRQVWLNISGESLRTLVFLPKHISDFNPVFKRLYRLRLLYNSTVQIIFDFGFIALFNRFGRFEAGISLVLYLVHKSAHLGMVLFGKTHMSLSSGIKTAILVGESNRSRYLLQALAILVSFYVILGFLFTPLFLMQRQTMHWLSPTGENMVVDPTLLAIGLLLTANCTLINMATTIAPYRQMRWMIFFSAIFLLISWLGRWLCPEAVQVLNVRHALIAFGIFQMIYASIMIKVSTDQALKRDSFSFSSQLDSHDVRLHTLSNLLANMSSELDREFGGAPGLFAVTFFRGKQWEPTEALAILSGVTEPEDLFAMWGPRTLIFFAKRADPQALHALYLKLIGHLAGHIENIKFCHCQTKEPQALLAALFQTESPVQSLYELGSNRAAASASPESIETLQLIEQWQNNQVSDSRLTELTKHGISLVKLEGQWSLDSLFPLEIRINARRFLRSLFQRQEFLAPDTTNPKDFGGFIHLNRNSRPSLLIHIPMDKRESLAALRFETFRLNFVDFIRHLNSAST